MTFRDDLRDRATQVRGTVVLAEGWDDRVAAAAKLIDEQGIATPLVLQGTDLPRVAEVAALLADMRKRLAEDKTEPVKEDPDKIVTRVDSLEIGTILRLKDVELPEGVEAASDLDSVVATVRSPEEEEEAPAEMGDDQKEPEVITAREKAEEEKE